jgi:hypothetical protein
VKVVSRSPSPESSVHSTEEDSDDSEDYRRAEEILAEFEEIQEYEKPGSTVPNPDELLEMVEQMEEEMMAELRQEMAEAAARQKGGNT